MTCLTDPTGAMATPARAAQFLWTPWLLGHSLIYAAALAAAWGRKRLRATLSKSKLRASIRSSSGGDEATDAALEAVFRRYDTSGDGFLQAGELKYAWRVATGDEMTEVEADELMRSIDTDGACAHLDPGIS